MESFYLETSVISYLASQPSRDLVVAANQRLSHDWWNIERSRYELYISKIVADEIARGDQVEAQKRLLLVASLTRLAVTTEVTELADDFLSQSSLPPSAIADSMHIALATVYGIDFLLTWNCRHIANAHIVKKLAAIAQANGYELPTLCTPLELLTEEEKI